MCRDATEQKRIKKKVNISGEIKYIKYKVSIKKALNGICSSLQLLGGRVFKYSILKMYTSITILHRLWIRILM